MRSILGLDCYCGNKAFISTFLVIGMLLKVIFIILLILKQKNPSSSYEAYALYQFFTLLVAFLDGERRLV